MQKINSMNVIKVNLATNAELPTGGLVEMVSASAVVQADGAIWHFLQISTPRASLLYSLTFKLSSKHESRHTLAGTRNFNIHVDASMIVYLYLYVCEDFHIVSISLCQSVCKFFTKMPLTKLPTFLSVNTKPFNPQPTSQLTHPLTLPKFKCRQYPKMRQLNFASSKFQRPALGQKMLALHWDPSGRHWMKLTSETVARTQSTKRTVHWQVAYQLAALRGVYMLFATFKNFPLTLFSVIRQNWQFFFV